MTDKLDTGRPVTARPSIVPSPVRPPVDIPTVLVFHDVASLVDSFRTPDPANPGQRAPTAPEQGLAPTTAPPPQAQNGLNGVTQNGHAGGSHTAVNGVSPVGVNGAHPGTVNGARPGTVNGAHPGTVNGAGVGAAGIAAPGYLPAPAPVQAPAPAPAAPTQSLRQPPAGTAAPTGSVTDEERGSYGVLLDRAAERGLLDSSEYEVRLRQLAEATSTAQMVAIVSELPAFTPAPSASAPHQSRSAIQSASRSASGDGQRRRLVIWVLMGALVLLALVSLVILALSVGRLSRSRSSMPPPPPAATRPVSALRL